MDASFSLSIRNGLRSPIVSLSGSHSCSVARTGPRAFPSRASERRHIWSVSFFKLFSRRGTEKLFGGFETTFFADGLNLCRRRPWFNASCRCLKLDRTLRGRAFSTAKLRYFALAPGLRCHGPAPGGGSGRQPPLSFALISVVYKSLKPPDPGATSQGPAGGDGWYVF